MYEPDPAVDELPSEPEAGASLLRLAQRCARQVSFTWRLEEDHLSFGEEVNEFLAPGLLADVRSGADLLERMDPADHRPMMDAIVQTLKGCAALKAEHRGIYETLIRLRSGQRGGADEQWHWIAMRGNVTEIDADGRGTRISGVIVDETQRETERRDAVRMRDLYAMLSGASRAISNAKDRESLLHELCQVAVQHGGFDLSCVAAVDPSSGTIKIVTQAGTPEGYPAEIAALSQALGLQSGSLALAAMRERQPRVLGNLRAAGVAAPWLPLALRAGFLSIGCFPLIEDGVAIGALLLHSQRAHHIDPAMASLLEGLCIDASHALDHHLMKRQQAEADRQLYEANRQFQTAMLSSLDGMLVVTGDGSVVEMNPAAHELLGCAGGIHHLITGFTPPRYRAARRAQVRRLLNPDAKRGTVQRRIETSMSRLDGTEVAVELVLTPLDMGAPGRLMVTVRDLTLMLKQRNELIDSSRRFEHLIEHAPDGMLVHIAGRIVLCNAKLRAMLGVERAEAMLNANIVDLFHPSCRPVQELRLAAIRRGEPLSGMMETQLLGGDGQAIDIDMLATETDYQGQKARQVVLRDIRERKRFERLQASQQQVLGLIAAREPIEQVLVAVTRAIEGHVEGALCGVFVADESSARFTRGFGSYNLDHVPDWQTVCALHPDSPAMIARAGGRREPIYIEDVRTLASTPQVTAWRQSHGRLSVGAWPLLTPKGDLMGVIGLALPEAGPLRAEVNQLIAEYASLAAVAIDNDRQAARIRHMAQHDVLTGLPNRAMFKEILDHALDRARRRGGMLAAMFIDLDRFKLINDTFGHDAGDAVLRETALRLQGAIRECDRVARMGGDEFFVLCDELTSPEDAATVAQRILAALAVPIPVGGQEHELSASIGIAVFARDGDDSDTLLKHADIAMYRAKQAGRNGYSFFAEADNVHTTERFALQAQLRRALHRQEFVLHYQPKVDLRSGRITGVEALVRWQHPERGLVMPGEFIALAEESGLIAALGHQVMEMAFMAATQLRETDAQITVAINLSALQMGATGFVQEVEDLVGSTGVEPCAVEFEITESVLMGQPEQARRVIETLRASGFAFSIDDFGTGYSSLTYLKRFPVQCVKIDRSFVKDIPGDSSDLAITQAIVGMAHSLGLVVVAEGVETAEQLLALRQMGCDQYQGYFFSKPVALEQAIARIRAEPSV